MANPSEADSLPVREAREGDGQAWDRLFHRYQLPLYAYVVELVNDEQVARDVVQEAFVNAARYLQRLRDDARFGSWLFSIARQKCLQHWRRPQHATEPLEQHEPEQASEAAAPDVVLVRREEEERFMTALRQLTPKHREVVLLHFLEDFSLREIADITGVGVGTVKSRMHYAKQSLRQAMERI
jgi:RNA polymerase sigma-70 factor (ECF subfamily)